MSQKYIHDEVVHNRESPGEIVPIILKFFRPQSVVDIGCGTGTFLAALRENGVNELLGVDGPWANNELLWKNLNQNEFMEIDLEKLNFSHIRRKFDLAMCLEVSEHLSSTSAENLVSTLTQLSQVVMFSAAVPYQGGQNHINEQWPKYWIDRFSKHNYRFMDLLRPLIWKNDRVQYWYKQNSFLVVDQNRVAAFEQFVTTEHTMDLIHPELYLTKANQLERVMKGKYPVVGYLKLLAKGLVNSCKN